MIHKVQEQATKFGELASEKGLLDSPMAVNARDLELELAWFAQLVIVRFQLYFGQEPDEGAAVEAIEALAPPDLGVSDSPYARFIQQHKLDLPARFAERVALVLSLVPLLRPRLLDPFYTKNTIYDRKFTEFGGVFNGADGDFQPTGETLIFILAGDDLYGRLQVQEIFNPDHFFARENVLQLAPVGDEPKMKARLQLSATYLSLFTIDKPYRPDFGQNFPARQIETQHRQADLVLQPATRRQIEEIYRWLKHGETLMKDWGMAAKLRPGYRSLFYGPPGTGKTMTAALLGQNTGRAVYKIDLSLVVSKYIGETEKNLAQIFDQAERKKWILFFDEADALFGKRTQTKDAHDRYANQEVSFLLQRVEGFDGMAILASNQRENLDEAFARRFESIIYFPMPRPEERLRLWEQGFSARCQPHPEIDLEALAEQYEFSGGAIMNIIRYVSLAALDAGEQQITPELLQRGIRLEQDKEGRY